MQDFWDFNRALTQRLMLWSGLSLALGLVMAWRGDERVKGIGSQFAGWAAVNAAIAFFGRLSADKKQRKVVSGELPEEATLQKEKRSLRRILWINTGLDVLYVLGGLLLRRSKGRDHARLRGVGEGIALQGAALFLFDLIHGVIAPR